jgi:hypothetical protein
MFYDMSSFARRSSMHTSLHGKDLMYISIRWSHVLIAYIELESTWIHDYPGASNSMSMSKKVDCYCSSGKTCYVTTLFFFFFIQNVE